MKNRRIISAWILAICLSGCVFAANDDERVKVFEKRQENGAIKLMAQLHDCLHITINVKLTLDNMDSSMPLDFTMDSNGKQLFELVTLAQRNRQEKWKYSYQYNWKLGGRGKVIYSDYSYSLPYKGSFEVSQGELGSFSHYYGSEDEYAIDWSMPEGTRVLAARAGVVSSIRKLFSQGGQHENLKKKANHIVIRHEDNTFAEYYHLKKNGVVVNLGQSVGKGQLIGFSGNTGYSSAPHLHFAVFQTIDGFKRRTIPVKFVTSDGDHVTMQQGNRY